MQSMIAGPRPDSPPPARPSTPSRARSWRSRLITPTIGVLVLGMGLGFVGSGLLSDATDGPIETTPAIAPASPPAPVSATDVAAGLADASAVATVAIPSVVTVQVAGPAGTGSGSGVVYDDAGRILTNDHVVSAGAEFRVVLSDGRTYQARLLGSDPSTDLAVLEIDATGLPPIQLGSTNSLGVGAPAIAVGSPLGLEGGPSLSVGVISSLEREVQTSPDSILYGMLQTDAPITQGSSGGALLDGSGRLIGITTAVGVSSVGVEGIGFATPVEIVERVADEIIASGDASDPFLGITGSTAYQPTFDGGEQPIGVTVLTVAAGSPAATAGVAVGDTIASVEGVAVHTIEQLISQLRRYSAGATVDLGLAGDTAEADEAVAVILGDRT